MTHSTNPRFPPARKLLTGLAFAVAACSDGTSPDPAPDPTGTPAMDIVAGDGQVDTVTHTLPEPLVVAVTRDPETGVVTVGPYRSSRAGDPMPGTLVNFRVTTNDCGEAFAGAAITDSLGMAADIWQLGTAARECRMEVRAVTSTGEPLVYDTFFATAQPGPAATIDLVVADTFAFLHAPLAVTDLVSAVRDAFGNPIDGATFAASGLLLDGDTLRSAGETWGDITIESGDASATMHVTYLLDLRRYQWSATARCNGGQWGGVEAELVLQTDSVRYFAYDPDRMNWPGLEGRMYVSGTAAPYGYDEAGDSLTAPTDTVPIAPVTMQFYQSPDEFRWYSNNVPSEVDEDAATITAARLCSHWGDLRADEQVLTGEPL